ncbi:MAG: acetylxylan esterase [Sedimentisphaerales bacterium]|nr:acetylxylan esterase [Sedimentisphaerales bacterium]
MRKALVLMLLMTFSGIVGAEIENNLTPSAGKLPQDCRLGELNTLKGYFPFHPVESAEQWARRSVQIQRQIRVAAGLWPWPDKTPLNPVIHGKMDMGDYTIEKVFFESFPGHFVTGNLYRPAAAKEKMPAVLCPHGHWGNGRFFQNDPENIRRALADGSERFESGARCPVQARCVQLARMGCIVFNYDMQGNADSQQLPHYPSTRPDLGNRENWLLAGPMAALHLQNNLGIQCWTSIRCVDFILSLPEVDPTRLAVTGCSGGGTQSMMLCALDDRVTINIPVVMVSTGMQGGCECENAPYLRIGAGNIDFAALTAPRPLYLISANDWTAEIDTKGLPDLKQLYALLGAADNVGGKTLLQFGHNYNCVSRSLIFTRINRQFGLGLKEPVIENDFRALTPEEMTVWDADHPAPNGDNTGEAYEKRFLRRLAAENRQKLDALTPRDEQTLAEYRTIVGGAWEVILGGALSATGPVTADILSVEKNGSYSKQTVHINFPARKEQLPALILRPKGDIKRNIIWITPEGKQGLLTADGFPRSEVKELLDCGCRIIGVDLLYQGDFLTDDQPYTKTRIIEGNSEVGSINRTFCYNYPLFCERVSDILTTIRYARKLGKPSTPLALAGLDTTSGPLVIAAAAMAQGAVTQCAADTGGFRFINITEVDDPAFVPGAAKYHDLPGLLALCAPGQLWLTGEPTQPELISASYRAAGAAANLTLYTGPDTDKLSSAITWLRVEGPF